MSALVVAALAVTACSTSKAQPLPTPTASSPSPTAGPKPGGTLRIAGVTRSVTLDPAAAESTQSPASGLPGLAAVSAADGNRLIGELVLRQLYGYPSTDPTLAVSPAGAASGPVPDLAAGGPKLSKDGRIATISLRTARWAVPSGRRVTANDEVRALKRLCLPTVNSPVKGYLAESVVGYAAGCATLASSPPTTLADLDAVEIPGLTTEGDTTLVIDLLRPTNDLTAILSLPETSPLPIESFKGLRVTNDPLSFVGDGPYRFVTPQDGETYALSRSPAWDPTADLLRHAYVDHVSIRGGLTAAHVLQLVSSGGADLSLDVPVVPNAPVEAANTSYISTPAQAVAFLAVGSRGPAALRLRVPGVRRVLAACIDDATRARIVAALGSGIASASDDLLTQTSLVPNGERSPSPTPSASPSVTPPSPGASGARTASGSPTSQAAPATAPTPALPPVPCARTIGVTGATLTLLTPATPRLEAASAVVVARLRAAGVRVKLLLADPASYALRARRGGWDLMLAIRPLRYPAPRGLLGPLLDGAWPGPDALAMLRSSAYAGLLLAANAERSSAASAAAWQSLDETLISAAVAVPLAQLNAVYPRGPNVASAPTLATFGNADPTNVALGSTSPGDPSRTPVSTP